MFATIKIRVCSPSTDRSLLRRGWPVVPFCRRGRRFVGGFRTFGKQFASCPCYWRKWRGFALPWQDRTEPRPNPLCGTATFSYHLAAFGTPLHRDVFITRGKRIQGAQYRLGRHGSEHSPSNRYTSLMRTELSLFPLSSSQWRCPRWDLGARQTALRAICVNETTIGNGDPLSHEIVCSTMKSGTSSV